jgi:hypothetical protein
MQNNIKMYHWFTTSYPRHIASDKLYEELSSKIDKFVEVYIGKYGRPKLSKIDMTLVVQLQTDQTVHTYIDKCIEYMLTGILSFVKSDDVDLLNIRDDIVVSLNQAKYLFTLR